MTLQFAAFAVGAVLVLIGLVGGGFKIIGQEFGEKVENPWLRGFSGIGGILLIAWALLGGGKSSSNTTTEGQPSQATAISSPAPVSSEPRNAEAQSASQPAANPASAPAQPPQTRPEEPPPTRHAEIGPVTYEVTVTTGCKDGAGTDADVYLALIGENGELPEQMIDTPNVDDNERCHTYSYVLVAPSDLGNLRAAVIRHDNSGSGPGWYLQGIHVRNLRTSQAWDFPCARWLATDEEDGHTRRVLHAGGPCE